MKLDLYSEKGTKLTATVELPNDIFGIEPKETALRQYIHVYQTNQRRGTAKAKTRGEVRGGGRKPWRQKGTGRARHGSIRSPIWVGGGVAHGPKPRTFALSIPKKIARLALKSALSLKVKEKRVKILQKLSFKEPKTALAVKLLKKLGLERRVLVVVPEQDENLYRSFRNIKKVEVRVARDLNAYDAVLADDLVLLEGAIGKLKERLVGEPDREAEKREPESQRSEDLVKKKAKKVKAVKAVKAVRTSPPRQARAREPSFLPDKPSGSKIKTVKAIKAVKSVKPAKTAKISKPRKLGKGEKKSRAKDVRKKK